LEDLRPIGADFIQDLPEPRQKSDDLSGYFHGGASQAGLFSSQIYPMGEMTAFVTIDGNRPHRPLMQGRPPPAKTF
jgi:hypothetical protein